MNVAAWALLAVAAAGWGVALAHVTQPASTGLVAGSAVFFFAAAGLAALDLAGRRIPPSSPRAIAWALVVLGASFVPMVWLTGTWWDDSALMYPAVLGVFVAPFATPWLCSVGPQPRWSDGRANPIVLAWLGLVLAFVLSSHA